MTSWARQLGAISMIAGTSIGAAMVAMPISMATFGTGATVVTLIISWAGMLMASFFMLESNAFFSKSANLVTMSEYAMGKSGYWICITAYLLLLYCLNAAYLAEFSASLVGLFSGFHLDTVGALIFSVVLIFFLAPSNRSGTIATVMLWGLVLTYLMIVGALTPTINLSYSHPDNWSDIGRAFPICILAFGYQIIIPSLRRFLDDDINSLKSAIYIGSSIPLAVYLIWMLLVMYNLPATGPNSLQSIAISNSLREILPEALASQHGLDIIHPLFHWFVIFAISTSLVGASVSLFDFVRDWLKNFNQNQFIISAIAFLPPAICVLFFPKLFIIALQPAGALVGVLLMILPVLNCIGVRLKGEVSPYQVPYFTFTAPVVVLMALVMIILDIMHLSQ
tara:strand:- start:6394 stop:7575 length:1182 start_codon:yes stop_codon:yes gene_type:complete